MLKVTNEDWKVFCGAEFDAYTRAVRNAYQTHNYTVADRPELFRDVFNEILEEAETKATALDTFYTSSIRSKLLAYELNESDFYDAYAEQSCMRLDSDGIPGLQQVAEKTSGKFNMLDHGSGLLHWGFGAAQKYPECTVYSYDYSLAVRRLIAYAIDEHSDVQMIFKLFGKQLRHNHHFWIREKIQFDFITSTDVLEHVENPVEELTAIADSLRTGGLMHLRPYFNSDQGRDPAHLQEHEHYDHDPASWIAEAATCGLEPTNIGGTERRPTVFVKV